MKYGLPVTLAFYFLDVQVVKYNIYINTYISIRNNLYLNFPKQKEEVFIQIM